MKTIIENTTNLSKYMFEDAAVISVEAGSITTPDFIVGDLNSGNCTLVEGVTAPADWVGNKYTFDGTTWAVNADYVEPEEPEEEGASE